MLLRPWTWTLMLWITIISVRDWGYYLQYIIGKTIRDLIYMWRYYDNQIPKHLSNYIQLI